MGHWEQNSSLVNELIMGRELARQLQTHLNAPSRSISSSQETREMLVQHILGSYEKALSILNSSTASSVPPDPPQLPVVAIGMSESSPSPLSGSPRSEDSDRDQDNRDGSKKRKSVPRWTRQVRVCPGMGLEGPLDDGFSWRKYGQKDILGAKYPRGYYRCIHRNVQGCLATKQVQRSDEDPTILEVTYCGRHACSQLASHMLSAGPAYQHHHLHQEPNNNNNVNSTNDFNTIISILHQQPHQEILNQQASQVELLSNFRTSLKVTTDDLQQGSRHQSLHNIPSSFHFPSTSSTSNNSIVLPSAGDSTNLTMVKFPPPSNNNSFVSPSNSSGASSYFSAASHQNLSGVMNQQHNFQNSNHECDELNHIITAASATNSLTVGFDPFTFENVDFQNFSFHNPEFLS